MCNLEVHTPAHFAGFRGCRNFSHKHTADAMQPITFGVHIMLEESLASHNSRLSLRFPVRQELHAGPALAELVISTGTELVAKSRICFIMW